MLVQWKIHVLHVCPYTFLYLTLKIKTTDSSEGTVIFYKITRCHSPLDSILHSHQLTQIQNWSPSKMKLQVGWKSGLEVFGEMGSGWYCWCGKKEALRHLAWCKSEWETVCEVIRCLKVSWQGRKWLRVYRCDTVGSEGC